MKRKTLYLSLPAERDEVRRLQLGDEVLVSGVIVTGRDQAHKLMVEKRPDFLRPILKGTAIYHCGPIVQRVGEEWKVIAAGPTTSEREEPYQADVIEHYEILAVIGKGGMGEKTSEALRRFGAVYLHAVGGAGTLLAERITKVRDVFMLEEFGAPEALWVLEVKDFPTIVTMDCQGNSLHREVLQYSTTQYKKLMGI